MRPIVAILISTASLFSVAAAPKPPTWRMAKAQGLEVLSNCDDYTTKAFLGCVYETLPLIGLPKEFQPPPGLPIELILTNQPLDGTLSPNDGPQGLRAMRKSDYLVTYEIVRDSDVFIARVSLLNWDADSTTEVVGLPFHFIPFFVEHHVPQPPAWVLDGFSELFSGGHGGVVRIYEDMLTLPGLQRTYDAVKDAAGHPERLLSFEQLFGKPPAPTQSAENARRNAELATFVRWGLYDHDGSHQKGFWTFAIRSCSEPITSALFRSCFDADYSEIRQQLSRYISIALWSPVSMRVTNISRAPAIDIRDATLSEFARIEGEWERLEAVELRETYPPLSQTYFETARRTLAAAYGTAPRDPRLVAALGLLHHDIGSRVEATRLLDEAIQANVFRPRAYLELARSRFEEAKRQPRGAAGKLDKQQTIDVLRPLFAVRRQSPAFVATYELIADVWAASAVMPQADQLAVFQEGMKSFPRDSALTFKAASFAVNHGFIDQASSFVAHGKAFASDDETRARFSQLIRSAEKP